MHELNLSAAVNAALQQQRPVVALESTLITHGFAYPRNVQVAAQLEQVIADSGVQPATIAVLGGRISVGLSADDLQHLGVSKDARKCSVRDLGIVAGLGLDGSTTVAATMFIAARVGIRVFATGGIGGVHRGHPFDVSADLTELARTPVTVVCAGAKALLDLPLTFEHLETLGVPVIGYQTEDIPAFYSRSSGLRADVCAESAQDVARIVRARRELGLPGGELVCVPVPRRDELPREEAEQAILAAQALADAQGIHGAASTPFLLDQIAKLTRGASVRANMALLLNNARVAAEIAHALLHVMDGTAK
jgi:pseudouridine-5'-phosphate glycosidase